MSRFTPVLLFAVLAIGCADGPMAPAADEGLAPQFAAASTNMIKFSGGPIPISGFVTCTGEAITGERTWKGHYKTTANDNGFHFNYHYQYQFDLVGASGRKYNGQGTTNETFNGGPGSDYYYRVHNKLIAQGENGGNDDFHYYELWRLKVLPDGTLQKDLIEFGFECR